MASNHPTWPEVATAKNENRHELVLSGAAISKRIEDGKGVDPAIFGLAGINYLNISETCLQSLPTQVSNLKNLTNLVLHSNKLTELPTSVCDLEKLKMLDVSRNALTAVPVELAKLAQLTSLNLASNKIKSLHCLQTNCKLIQLDLSLNELEDFPDVCYQEMTHLSEIKLQGNKINNIPHSISALTALKSMDLSENNIKIVPVELADISKLKDISLKGNVLSDKRLMKLVDQCKPKQVLDYVRQHGERASAAGSTSGGGGKKGKKGKNKNPEPEVLDVIEKLTHKLQILHVSEVAPQVIAEEESIKLVRPHIVCCIIKNVKFSTQTFRSFISLQTRLHDTVCQKRQLATIATHDLAKLPAGPVHYCARPPARLRLVPLGHDKDMSAVELIKRLQEEAEDDPSISGVHRYLSLLEGKQVYPCLKNCKGKVISLPPITNSDISKISECTTDIFIEVTSANSQGACKTVLHELLLETLDLGIGDEQESTNGFHSLVVEQVKVVNPDGNLKVVYPSRVDLQVEEAKNITVIRD